MTAEVVVLAKRRSRRWCAADLAWEQAQTSAVEHYQAGRFPAACRLWNQGLEMAEMSFETFDPRLATSLTNQAYVQRCDEQQRLAELTFCEALGVWEASWRWIERMTPEGTGEAERKNGHAPGTPRLYGEEDMARLRELAGQGRDKTVALYESGLVPIDDLSTWRSQRPTGFSDLRKLLGSVLLVVSLPA